MLKLKVIHHLGHVPVQPFKASLFLELGSWRHIFLLVRCSDMILTDWCKTWKQGENIWQELAISQHWWSGTYLAASALPFPSPNSISFKQNRVLYSNILYDHYPKQRKIFKLQRTWQRLEFISFLPLCSHWWMAEEFQLLARVKVICFLAFSLMSWTVLEFCANSHIQYHILNCTRENNQDKKALKKANILNFDSFKQEGFVVYL